jgi:hypothetical protein
MPNAIVVEPDPTRVQFEIAGDLLLESLWSLVRLVDGSAEGQKAILDANGASILARYLLLKQQHK